MDRVPCFSTCQWRRANYHAGPTRFTPLREVSGRDDIVDEGWLVGWTCKLKHGSEEQNNNKRRKGKENKRQDKQDASYFFVFFFVWDKRSGWQ